MAYHMKTKSKYYLTQAELLDLLCYEDSCEYYFQALIYTVISDNRLVSIVFNRAISENNCTIQISLESDFPIMSSLQQTILYRNDNRDKSDLKWRKLAAESGIVHMRNILSSLESSGMQCLRIRALFLLDTKDMLWLSRVCEVDWVSQACANYEPGFVPGSKIITGGGGGGGGANASDSSSSNIILFS